MIECAYSFALLKADRLKKKSQYHLRSLSKSVATLIAVDVAATVKNCMEQAFAGIISNVPFVVDPEIRDSWDDDFGEVIVYLKC